MKKSKQIISLVAATALSYASLVNVCTDAALFTPSKDKISSILDGYTKVESYDAFEGFEHTSYSDWYVNDNGLYIVDNYANEISLTTPDDIDKEDFWKTVSEIIPDSGGYFSVTGTDTINETLSCSIYCYRGKISDEESIADISDAQARQLYETLNEKGYLTGFEFYGSRCQIVHIDCAYPTAYYVNNKESLEAYAAENELDCSVIEATYDDDFWKDNGWNGGWSNAVCLVPNYELNTIEHYGLANQIARDTGLRPLSIAQVSDSSLIGEAIDMYNAIEGDANEDGNMDMADAVTILQSLANPDKYALSAQARFNGDVANTGDGITAQDALIIQRKLIKLE